MKDGDIRNTDSDDWLLAIDEEDMQMWMKKRTASGERISSCLEDLINDQLLCCPEDQECSRECMDQRKLCSLCRIPICKKCGPGLTSGKAVPIALANDNWYGYADNFIYENNMTWIEKTRASPYWTSIMLFSVDDVRSKTKNTS